MWHACLLKLQSYYPVPIYIPKVFSGELRIRGIEDTIDSSFFNLSFYSPTAYKPVNLENICKIQLLALLLIVYRCMFKYTIRNKLRFYKGFCQYSWGAGL